MTFIEWGAFAFGAVIGWFTYYVNRYRASVQLADVATIVGALGGGAVLALFPEKTRLFAAYGLGLAAGFFVYFVLLVIMVWRAKGFTAAYFLDGRRPALDKHEIAGDDSHPMLAGENAAAGL
ncbi:hypothetical protein ACPPVO_19700 [Dactylosporangium sp. McL0621]|uniref:hypothetical protein n=1 Tax=Dactylosporangium sp. McL0621 TaxID=3415678 RepID=UPI003CE80FA4